VSKTIVRFRSISARTFAHKYLSKKHITVFIIIRAHRGRDFAQVLPGVRELRALEVAPWSSILWKNRDEFSGLIDTSINAESKKVEMVRARFSDDFSYKNEYESTVRRLWSVFDTLG